MDLTVAERLTAVETKVGAMQTTLDSVAEDGRFVRDWVLAEKARRGQFRRIFSGLGGMIAAGGVIWEFFRK